MEKILKFRAYHDGVFIFNDRLTNGQIIDRFSIVDQFTGLKDKNGNDIYENDILRKGEICSFVTYMLSEFRFNSYMPNGPRLYDSVDFTRGEKFEIAEIIGNMHQHKYLLK